MFVHSLGLETISLSLQMEHRFAPVFSHNFVLAEKSRGVFPGDSGGEVLLRCEKPDAAFRHCHQREVSSVSFHLIQEKEEHCPHCLL